MARRIDAAPAPAEGAVTFRLVARDTIRFVLSELKPKGKMLTPFNVISGAIILLGLVLIVIRFAFGLSAVTNLSQHYPWGNSFGISSVMFLVAWHFLLYMICELVEFSPAVAEWLNWPRMRRIVAGLTTGASIFGITLSPLPQWGLGALFLLAPSKIHPLWY